MNIIRNKRQNVRRHDDAQHSKGARDGFGLSGGSSLIWKSSLSWRITLTVFATILLVQTLVMIFTVPNYDDELENELRSQSLTAVTLMMEDSRDLLQSPVTPLSVTRLLSSSPIRGIYVYNSIDGNLLYKDGADSPLNQNSVATQRSADNAFLDTVLQPDELRAPYRIVLRIDSTGIEPRVRAHVNQTLVILFLMSGFVTSVLMLAMGSWLLEPMMLLRNNLLAAVKEPESPKIAQPRRESHDEIGVAIRIANDLIRQNADNIRRQREEADDKIHQLAYYDTLTKLPNRTYLMQELDRALQTKVKSENKRLAIMSVDLDHFKDINDTMGHEIGDRLLEAFGRRLVKALPKDTLVARASADEFIVMAELTDEHPESAILVEKIFTAMTEPIGIYQERFSVRVSVGVAHAPEDAVDAHSLIKNADIALNRAKEEGRDTVRYYSQDFDNAVQQRFQMLRDLRVALDENQLQLHYHPQFDLKTGKLIGAEALLRWFRPDASKEGGSFVPPIEFIPVAEQSGLIVPIGEWVLRTACNAAQDWKKMGLGDIRIAVNISGVQFHRGDIIQQVGNVIRDTGINPHFLELEVTESVFMENIQTAIDTLDELHKLGCELAVDDFGTGYSSLSYLRQFPIDRLKIDQSFVRNALVNPGDRMIARTIINLGHSLGLKVIAEGVETSDHETFLKEDLCDEVQGYKYSKPIPNDKFIEYARTHQRELAQKDGLQSIDGGKKA